MGASRREPRTAAASTGTVALLLASTLFFGLLPFLATPVQAATLSGVAISAPLQTTGSQETWTFAFTTVSGTGAAGDVRVVFPGGFTANALSACDVSGITGELATVVSTTEIVCELGALNSLAATTSYTMTVTLVTNPTTVQSPTGSFTVETRNTLNSVVDSHTTNTETITASALTSVALSAPLQRTGAVETWTVSFTTKNPVAAGGDLRIVFPSGFTLSSGSATACDVTAPLTVVGETTSISGQDAVCTLGGLDSIAATTAVTLTLTNVKNPSPVQTTGAFTVQTRDASDVVHDEHTSNTESITANTLASLDFSAPLQRAGATETWTLTFTTVNAVAAGGDLRIVLPSGFTTSSGSATVCDIVGKSAETTTVVSATVVVCELNSETLGAATAVSLTLTNLLNPSTVQTTGAFTVQTRDGSDVVHDEHATSTESIVANLLTSVLVSAPSQTAGAVETWTVQFTTTNAVAASGDIRIVFPSGFTTSSGSATVCDVAGKTGESTTVVSGTEVVCELGTATLSASEAVGLTLTNVKNPGSAQTTGAFTVQTRSGSDAVHDAHASNTEAIGAGLLTSVSISAPLQTTGSVETWTFSFTTVNAVSASGDVRIVFPAGFTTSSGLPSLCAITGKVGITTTVVSGTEVVCNLNVATLSAAEAATLTITNVKNPTTSQTTGAFTVQTRDGSDNVQDAHTTNVETISAGILASVGATAPTRRAGAVETWTLSFTTVNAVAANGDVRIVLPTGFVTSSGGTSACDLAGKTGETTTVVSSTEIVCELNSATLGAAESVSLTLTNLKNPTTVQTTGAFTLQTRDASDGVHDAHATATASIVANVLASVGASAPLQATGGVETWTFQFTTVNPVAASGDIRIVFPSGFTTSSGATTVCDVAGTSAETTTVVSSTQVVCELNAATLPAAQAVSLTLTSIKNPAVAQTTGAFTIQTRDSANAVHDEHTSQTVAVVASSLTSFGASAPLQTTSSVETWTFLFTTVNAVAATGDVRIVFPTGFTTSSGLPTVCSIAGKIGVTTTVVSGTEVVCELNLATIAAAEAVVFTLTNVKNPTTAQTTGAFTVQTRDGSNAVQDAHTTNTEVITARALTGVSVTAPTRVTGATETWTVAFTVASSLTASGDLRIVFPTGFSTSSGAASVCDVAGKTGEATTVVSATEVTCDLGSNTLSASEAVSLTLTNVRNPATAQTTGAFTLQVRDASDGVQDAGTSTTATIVAAALTGVAASAPLQAAGAVETWTFAFTTANAVAANGDVRIAFPSGFQTSSGAATVCDVAGTTAEFTTVVSATEVVCDLNSATFTAGQGVSLSLTNVKDPTVSQTTGAFTLQTRDSLDAVHDQHTSNTEAIGAGTLLGVGFAAPVQLAALVETWTIQFTTVNPVADGGDVRVVFPAGFQTSSGATTVCAITGKTLTTSVASATEVVCTLAGSTLSAAEPVSLSLTNVKNPTTGQTTGAFTLQTRAPTTDAVHDQHLTNTETIVATLTAFSASAPLQRTGLAETWTFSFTSPVAVGANGDLRLVFPTGFQTSVAGTSVCDISGKTLETTTLVGATEVVCNLNAATISAGEAVIIAVNSVRNPLAVQTTGAFVVQARDASDAVLNSYTTNTESIVASPLASFSGGGSSQRQGATTTWTFTLQTTNAVAPSGDIRIVFPAGYQTSYGATTACDIVGLAGESTNVVSATEVACELGANALGAGAPVSLTLSNVRNPNDAIVTATFLAQTRDGADAVHDEHASFTTTIAASVLREINFRAPLQTTGSVETWTLSFVPGRTHGSGSDIRIVWPEGFRLSLSGTTSACDISGVTGETTTLVSSTELLCNLNSASLAADQLATLTMTQVKNPRAAKTTGVFTLQLRDGSDTILEQSGSNREEMAAHAFAVVPALKVSDAKARELSTYTLNFTTFNTWPADGKLRMTLPAGYVAASFIAVSLDATFSVPGAGTFATPTLDGQTAVLGRQGGSELPANTQLSLRLIGLRNPDLESVGPFSVTITEADGTPIETGTTTGLVFAGASGKPAAEPIAVETPEATVEPSPTPEPSKAPALDTNGRETIPIRLAPGLEAGALLLALALGVWMSSRRRRA